MIPITPVKKISIREAIQKIVDSKMLLPVFQREFVWKPLDIELMFDSMLRGYPINTLMFWRIDNISNQNLEFYRFLDANYVDGISHNSQFPKSSAGNEERLIVIDGQQRLTSIYIGISGSITTSNRKPKQLYLRLDAEATSDDKKYDFRFLALSQVEKLRKNGETWLLLKDLLSSKNGLSKAMKPLLTNGNDFATNDLYPLLTTFLDTPEYLHYYDISGYPSIDDVLEVFTRTNNSGMPLSKGDLLLSVMATKWTSSGGNARDYVSGIIDDVRVLGYSIDRDWVIRCCMVVFGASVKMKVSNLATIIDPTQNKTITDIIFDNKDTFKQSIISTFYLICKFGLLEKGLSTKLAVIPIVQFIYKNGLWSSVQTSTKGHNVGTTRIYNYRHDIRKWLFRAIAFNFFNAGTDDKLTKLRDIIRNKSTKQYFPFMDIENCFSNELSIDNKKLVALLDTPKKLSFPVLNIIFSEKLVNNKITKYDIDHTHPATLFKNVSSIQFNTQDDEKMARDGFTYNCVRNLQLLESGDNKSKNKDSLTNWVAASNNPSKLKRDHFIPQRVSLQIEDFKTYIDARSILLLKALKKYLV